MKLGPKVLWPALALLAGLVATTALVVARPTADAREITEDVPVVRVLDVAPAGARMTVTAQGSVEPRTESDLVSEVGGRVVWTSPALDEGGAFMAGDVLVRIEPRDYETARERARAAVERAESQLSLAKASHARRRSLHDAGASSPAALEEADNNARIAAANLREARAALSQAELDLERTEVRAPFDGRVRSEEAVVGQFVGRGAQLARIYASDFAEVRLPLTSDDLAFLDLPSPAARTASDAAEANSADLADSSDPTAGSRVTLRGRFAGADHAWEGTLVRSEGALDPRTRMLNVVARVRDPFVARGERPALSVGLFVTAEIEGRLFDGLVPLPRAAVRDGGQVLIVDSDSRLRFRSVDVLRTDGEHAFIRSGLAAGDRVCVTAPAAVVDGMRVAVAEPNDSPSVEPASEVAASPAGPRP